jgi:hypothetical protein
MCVIIVAEPGVVIPQDKLELACDINKQGFGLSWGGKTKIETERSIEDNDPKAIAKLLEQTKTHRRFLHLRYATVGEVTMENSHPFIGMNGTFGMMHNGTLYNWKPLATSADKDRSDSFIFFRDMVEPMAKMAHKFSGPTFLLENMIFRKVLLDYIIGNSVVVLFDNKERKLTLNVNKGKQFEGWWASNDYSFDEQHIRSSTRTPYSWAGAYGAYDNKGGKQGSTLPFDLEKDGGKKATRSVDLPGVQLHSSTTNAGNIRDFF